MVLPIGAKDSIEARGYVIHECPSCGRERIFAVYDTNRKLTLFFVPTINVRAQFIMECATCHGRWGIPEADRPIVEQRLMTHEQVLQRIAQMQHASTAMHRRGAKTFYQVLQVDPEADHDVIEAAFRRLALKYHPDTSRDPLAEGKMHDILRARDVLLDPVARRTYDETLGIEHRVEALRPEEV